MHRRAPTTSRGCPTPSPPPSRCSAPRRLADDCAGAREVISSLFEQLRRPALDAAAVAPVVDNAPVVINQGRHEVVDRDVVVAMASRTVLRRLLYAFVAADGHYLDRNAISHALWGASYAPLRHESSLKSNVRRLRELLERTRLVIETDRDGYRLSIPSGALIVGPASAPEPSEPPASDCTAPR